MNPMEQQGLTPEQMQQMQMAAQAQQGGLGTPPQAPFEYKENPSMTLMNEKVQQQLADVQAQKQAQMQEQNRGYAGYHGDPSAGVGTNQGGHPNEGWSPSSPEAHQLNMQLADRIKSGSIDPRTAMIALQHPDVSPEVKQALSQIVQQTQSGNMAEPAQAEPSQPSGGGLGSVGIPQ